VCKISPELLEAQATTTTAGEEKAPTDGDRGVVIEVPTTTTDALLLQPEEGPTTTETGHSPKTDNNLEVETEATPRSESAPQVEGGQVKR
jgi:hypothetical protein